MAATVHACDVDRDDDLAVLAGEDRGESSLPNLTEVPVAGVEIRPNVAQVAVGVAIRVPALVCTGPATGGAARSRDLHRVQVPAAAQPHDNYEMTAIQPGRDLARSAYGDHPFQTVRGRPDSLEGETEFRFTDDRRDRRPRPGDGRGEWRQDRERAPSIRVPRESLAPLVGL